MYMRSEFGLDSLPEHALVEVEPDTWVVNPAWRQIDKALKQARNRVGHLRRKRALAASAEPDTAHELDAQIQACEETVEGFAVALQVTDKHMPAGELSDEEKLQTLPAPLRLLMQTLRMLAYRAETRDGGLAGTTNGQSRDRPQPAQGTVPQRRQLVARPGRRHADRAPAAPGQPRPRYGARPAAGRVESHAHRVPRNQPAPRLRITAPAMARRRPPSRLIQTRLVTT